MNRTRGFKLVGPIAAVAAVGILAFGFSLNASSTNGRNEPKKSKTAASGQASHVESGDRADGSVLNPADLKSGALQAASQNGEELTLAFAANPRPRDGGDSTAGVGTCPNAGGFPGSGEITQNTNQVDDAAGVGSVACGGAAIRNQWGRCYNHVAEGATVGLNVLISGVEFYTFSNPALPVAGVPGLVNIYLLPGACPGDTATTIPFTTADLIASVSQQITTDGVHNVTFSPAVLIPAGTDFFVEIERPQDATPDPNPTDNFFASANDDEECDDSYIRCGGITAYTTMTALGFPNIHIVEILSTTQQLGGTVAVCGNGTVEAGEDCDPPGAMCSIECQNPGAGFGACCNGITCSVTHAPACTGTYLGDNTNCSGSPCSTGACCTANGQTCAENVSLATCMGMGGTLLAATDCSPNCCPTTRFGDDVCTTANAGAPIAVPGTQVRSGDTMADVALDPTGCNDPMNDNGLGDTTVVRWEKFTINSCANVTIDLCCTDPTRSPLFTTLLYKDDCACATAPVIADGYSSVFTGGTLPGICTSPVNWHAVWNDLAPGTYAYPLFVTDGTTTTNNHEYTMHITTTACAVGRCCNAGVCTAGLDETTCTSGGGFWGGAGSLCFPPGACNSGACCVDGVCTDGQSAALCSSNGGDLFPGQSCVNVTCPPANDDCTDRQVITDGTIIVDTTAATTDGPVLNSPCGNTICAGGGEPAGTGCFTNEDCTLGGTCTGMGDNVDMINDVWYNYTAECDGTLFVSACVLGICQSGSTGDLCASDSDCGAVGGCPLSLFDSVVAVYDGTTCPPTTLLTCDDDDPDCLSQTNGTVEVSVVGGQSYKIRVGTFLGTTGPTSGVMAITVAHRASGGACCQANGTCSHVANAGACAGGIFRAGLCCSETTCNAADSCDWNNGPANTGGVASQFAPGEFYAEAADNFIMAGSGANDCELDSVQFNVSHFNVSAMCTMPACTNSPTDYASIHFVIYEDATNSAVGVKTLNFDVVPDVAIPDCDGVTDVGISNVQIVNEPGNIVDVDVDLDITHSFVGDVIVELSHNNGIDTVNARIVERPGVFNTNSTTAQCSGNEPFDLNIDDSGALTDNITAVLDDEDTNDVDTGPFPINGRYRPFPDALSIFDGRTKTGTWTLTVFDAQTGDLGTLNAWSLHFTNSGAEGQPKGPDGSPQPDGSHIGNMVANLELAPPYNCVPFGTCTGGTAEGAGCINNTPCTGGGTCTFTGSDFQCTPDLSSFGITLDKNTKYWLAISPEVPFTNFYQTAIGTSDTFDGNPTQQIFPELGLIDWTKQGGTDLGFVINGTKGPGVGCPCTTLVDCRNTACMDDNGCNHATCMAGICVYTCERYGDVFPAGGNGVVNLDDILCILSGFANFPSCPNADISPCGGNGIVNLDDILAVLSAFGGANPCTCTENGMPGGGVAPLCGSSSP